MSILVATPIAEEFEAIEHAFGQRGLVGRVHSIGRMKGLAYSDGKLLLFRGGLGKAQFGVRTQHLIDHADRIEVVICTGVAGALAPHVSIGDVVVATWTVEHDFNAKSNPEGLPTFDGHEGYLSALKSMETTHDRFKLHFGPIASGDEAILETTRARELYETTGALAVAWEGAGGARAAAFSKLPYLEVRGISDTADESAVSEWVENISVAADNVVAVLESLVA